MEKNIFILLLAGISTLVVCQTPCPSHLTCGNQTQHAYNKANGNIQLQCNALYEGLQCLETAECPQEYKVGLAEALTFAKQELQDLNCTHASTTIARTENTGFSLCPVWGLMFLAALIVTCPGHLL